MVIRGIEEPIVVTTWMVLACRDPPAHMPGDRSARTPPLITRRMSALLVLLVAALAASVVIPALETRQIGQLLDEDEAVVQPARLSARRSIELLALESSMGRRFANLGDSASLQRLRVSAAAQEQELGALREFAANLNGEVRRAVADLDPLIDRWRSLNRASGEPTTSIGAFRASADAREAVSDSLILGISRVQIALSAWSARRRAEIWSHERRGLWANIALVFSALGAIALVVDGGRRERRRAWQVSRLMATAESLWEAQTVDEAAQRIAAGGRDMLSARGVYVEHVENRGGGTLVVRAADGVDVPAVGFERPLPGSVAERVAERGGVVLYTGDQQPRSNMPSDSSGARGNMIAIPLISSGSPFAVVIALESDARRFRPRDLDACEILGEIASLAYERIRLLEETQEARKRLERAMQSRSRLMRGFSHDVKNPLGAADGYIELLTDGIYGRITDGQRQTLERIRNAIRRALSLIDDLHELARAETGNITIRRARTNVAELVRAQAEDYRAAAGAKQLELLVETDPLPPTYTDAARIRQIVGNLLSNAIKYTDTGAVTLRARMVEDSSTGAGKFIVIDVKDTGPGIPREQLRDIFREFSRGANQKQPGAGIGLAMSKLLADALGCRIEVKSEEGEGSTFSLHIPVVSS